MRVVLNSFTRKRTSSLKKNLLSPNFSEPHVYLSRYIRRASNRTSDKWATVIFLWWLHIQIRSFCIVFWSLLTFIGQFWHFHAQTAVPTSCTEVLASPQFRPPSLQMKAVFRQGFSRTFAKLSRKINLYDRLERFSNSPIHSQNAQGRDIMRRTQDTKVFGVAFLPGKHAFGHWSRLYTYHIYINFRQIFSQKIISFRHFKKKL